MKLAAQHKGTSVIDILQNCVIFNDKIHNSIIDKAWRDERTILLKNGEKMIFGKDQEKGLVLDGWNLKAVTIGEDGYTMDDILTHDATCLDFTLHMKLGQMSPDIDGLPLALGVIRSVEAPAYDAEMEKLIEDTKKVNKVRSLNDYLMSLNKWEVK